MIGVNRDFIDSMLIARHEAENEGDEAVLEKLDDAYLIHTVADIFLGSFTICSSFTHHTESRSNQSN